MSAAREMWETLVSDHTQRDFSYAMLLKCQLYQCIHEPGQSMAEFTRTMAQLRQQLRNMGAETCDHGRSHDVSAADGYPHGSQ